MRRALVLILTGSGVALLAAARTWTTRVVDHGASLPLETLRRSGQDLEPGLRPLALVGLAAVLALVASRGWTRRAVGVLVACAGTGIAWLALGRTGATAWPLLAAAGGLAVAGGGLLALVQGARWGGLSDAYRTPAARADQAPVTDKGVWDALDRGEDPTAEPHR